MFGRILYITLGIIILNSGCLANSAGDKNNSPYIDIISETSYAKSATWSDCKIIVTSSEAPGRSDTFPHPPGWEPPITRQSARVFMQAWECDRISWGHFERPLLIFFESHDNFNSPPDCDYDLKDMMVHEVLNTIWVNDTEFAKYLNEAYGLPVIYSDMTMERVSLPLGNEYTFRWGIGNLDSWISTTDDLGQSQSIPYIQRFFWYNETTLGALDFSQNLYRDMTSDNIATGNMYEPMLMSKFSESYASVGQWNEPASALGTIKLFGDLECKKAL